LEDPGRSECRDFVRIEVGHLAARARMSVPPFLGWFPAVGDGPLEVVGAQAAMTVARIRATAARERFNTCPSPRAGALMGRAPTLPGTLAPPIQPSVRPCRPLRPKAAGSPRVQRLDGARPPR